MENFKSVTVFCASSVPANPAYSELAMEVGKYFAHNNIALIYGGGNRGLMGDVANACMNSNGNVIGIIPHFLAAREYAHTSITELIFTDDMEQRKNWLFQKSEAILILPGGMGTMDELFEAITNVQLKLISHKIILFNFEGFYDSLLIMLKQMERNNFVTQTTIDKIIVVYNMEECAKALLSKTASTE